jgi:hypothetical protein
MSKLLFRKALMAAVLTTSALPLLADPVAPEPTPGVAGGPTTMQTIIQQIIIIFG